MDGLGVRSLADDPPATRQFLFADFNRSIQIHHTSLSLDDDSRVFCGLQGKLIMVAEGVGAGRVRSASQHGGRGRGDSVFAEHVSNR